MSRSATKPSQPRFALAAIAGLLLLSGGSWTTPAQASPERPSCCAAREMPGCCCVPSDQARSIEATAAESLRDACGCQADEAPVPAERPERRDPSSPRDREPGDVAAALTSIDHADADPSAGPATRPESGRFVACLLRRTSRLRF